MDKDVVEVSTEVALYGLYVTSDMWLYSMFASHSELKNAVQTIIHAEQPLTSNYARYGDFLNESFHQATADGKSEFGSVLMNVGSFAGAQRQIDHAVHVMVEVAIAIIDKTNNLPDDSLYPRVIPDDFENLRFNRPLKVTRDDFQQMFMAEPWFSWIELMRGQMERNRRSVQNYNLIESLRIFRNNLMDAKGDKKATERREMADTQQARKAIKRAYKLHERIFGVSDVKSLINKQSVLIKGHHFNYRLDIQKGKLFKETIVRDSKMAPTWLYILGKKDGKELGTACLYFNDTGLLDHLLNVKMCVSNASAELDMIKAFHITSVTKRFFDDPVLPDLKGVHDPVTAPLTTTENICRHASPQWRKTTQQQIMFGPLWHEAEAALMSMLRFPKGYRSILRKCAKHSFWRFVFDEEEAMSVIDGKLESELFN